MGSVGASLVIWAFCGVVSLVFALCYAEIGTTIPASGADYSYIKEIFSPFLGFLALWMNIIFVGKMSWDVQSAIAVDCDCFDFS